MQNLRPRPKDLYWMWHFKTPERETYVKLSVRGTVKIPILWERVCLFTNSENDLSLQRHIRNIFTEKLYKSLSA